MEDKMFILDSDLKNMNIKLKARKKLIDEVREPALVNKIDDACQQLAYALVLDTTGNNKNDIHALDTRRKAYNEALDIYKIALECPTI